MKFGVTFEAVVLPFSPAWEKEGPGAQRREDEGDSRREPGLNRRIPSHPAPVKVLTRQACATLSREGRGEKSGGG